MSLSTMLSLLTSSSSTTSSSTGVVEEATTIITNTTTYTNLFNSGLLSNKSNASLIGRANEGVGRDYNGNDNNTAIHISSTSLLTNLTMRSNSSGNILGNKNSSDFYFDNTTTVGDGTTSYMNVTYGSTTEGPSFLERTVEYTPLFYFLTTILMFVYVCIYFLHKYEHKKAAGEAMSDSKKGTHSRWATNVLSENSDVLDDDDIEVSDATVKFSVQRPQPPPAAPEASELGLMSSWRI